MVETKESKKEGVVEAKGSEKKLAKDGKDLIPEEFIQESLKDKVKIKKYLDESADYLKKIVKDETKWTSVKKGKNTEVFWFKDTDKTYCQFLTVSVVERTPRDVYSFLRADQHRLKWDRDVSRHERIAPIDVDEESDLGYDLTYTRTQPICGGIVTARSFLNLRVGKYDESTGSFYESAVSIDAEIVPETPERTDCSTKAKLFFGSGGLFEPANGGKHCKMSYVTFTDPCGWLPHALVNKIMPSEMVDYFTLIKNTMAAEKYAYQLIHVPGTKKEMQNAHLLEQEKDEEKGREQKRGAEIKKDNASQSPTAEKENVVDLDAFLD